LCRFPQGVFENDCDETTDARPRLRSKRSQSTPAHQEEPCLKDVRRPFTPQPPPPTQHSLLELAQVFTLISCWSVFQLSVKSNLCLLWFCFTSLCDFLGLTLGRKHRIFFFKKLAPFPQAIINKTETNCDLLTYIFPCLICNLDDKFIVYFASVVISQRNDIGFGFATLS